MSTVQAASRQFGDEQELGFVAPPDGFARSPEHASVDVHPVQFSHPLPDGPADGERFSASDHQGAQSEMAPVFQAAGSTPNPSVYRG